MHQNFMYIALIISLASVYLYTDIIMIFFAGPRSIGFATDPFENKLYFTDLYKRTVNMVKLATGEKTTIVNKTYGRPYDLVLDRKAR